MGLGRLGIRETRVLRVRTRPQRMAPRLGAASPAGCAHYLHRNRACGGSRKTFSRLNVGSNVVQDFLHILFGSSIIQNTSTQGESAAKARVRKVGAAGALRRQQDALIICIGTALVA